VQGSCDSDFVGGVWVTISHLVSFCILSRTENLTWVFTCAVLCQHSTSYHAVPLYQCLSVTSRRFIKTSGRIELVFGMEASFEQSCTTVCFKEV